ISPRWLRTESVDFGRGFGSARGHSHPLRDRLEINRRVSPAVRFLFEDPGHNAAAYHPDNRGKPELIPQGAAVWDSGFKNSGQEFEVSLSTEGVHHYYCLPHEGLGMVGMIAVGDASKGPGLDAVENADIPGKAKQLFRELHNELKE
ncbi:MAG: plastocyanin/azurin family copper-binding protein, partial [Thiohalorhabdaceae bacterium]